MLGVLLALGIGASASAQDVPIELEVVAEGFSNPLGVITDGRSDDLYVMEQTGTVRIVRDGEVQDAPFLDLTGHDFTSGGEQGLLGMVFHPDHPNEVFVHYSDADGDTVLSRMPVRDGRAVVDEERRMLTVPQPYPNHNGGKLAVGPDGMLYLGLGDGGAGGDPQENGQDPTTLLGTILRLDPAGDPVAVPDDNPFVGSEEGAAEVWHYGLRNPWRFSFDQESGTLWIADVGQNRTEEVNRVPAGEAGLNFGWNVMEGDHCFEAEECDASGMVAPVATYDHDAGWGQSVTGGYVYRGSAVPSLQGAYVFGDFTGGNLLVARESGGEWQSEVLLEAGFPISSFGEDANGELLILDYGGRLLRMVAP